MRKKLLATMVSLVLVAAQSQAAIRATATNKNAFVVSDNVGHFIPLTDAGGTSEPQQNKTDALSEQCSAARRRV